MPMFRCDLIIRNATLFDGTGAPRLQADIAVRGERIEAVGELGDMAAARELDATGLAVAPGFIDAHTHDDRLLLSEPCPRCKLSQGVTTVIAGNCGVSLAPLRRARRPPPPLDLLGDESWWRFASVGEYADTLDREPPAVNAMLLVGHTTLRVGAMGDDLDRAATDAEIAAMQAALKAALAEGGIGLSTGLYYPPAIKAPTEEVVALAEVAAAAGGIYVTHMRDEGRGVQDSIAETLRIGREAGLPAIISHHKCVGPENFGRSRATLAQIEAGAAGQHVGLDVYPYAAASTVLLPKRLRPDIPVMVTWSVPHPEMTGRMIDAVAREWGVPVTEAAERLLPAGAIYFQMDEADVQRIIAHPRSMIGSDGLPHDAHPHPRLWGTFPRVLGHYARELGIVAMEDAVRKMTSLPAAEFGIADRGTVRPGAYADLVLFDAATVKDSATFERPTEPAAGIVETWVNGRSVWRDGAATGERPGRLLRRGAGQD
ncbi:MAG: D-aminoacylase [Alphaproteobacteria bacterium]|nr:D-aminoacylase [Alphaproteobacteria bacterium]